MVHNEGKLPIDCAQESAALAPPRSCPGCLSGAVSLEFYPQAIRLERTGAQRL
jgi:hypothetical protein